MSNIQTLIKELRALDYNSYLCTTLSYKKDFAKIAAISLLHVELKKITTISEEEMVAMIRLTWWQENLEEIFVKSQSKKHHLLETILEYKADINYDLLKEALSDQIWVRGDHKGIKNKEDLQQYIYQAYEIFFLLMLDIVECEEKSLAKNLAQISFYYDLLKMIKNEDEEVVGFFYPAFFNELGIEVKSWQKNDDDENLCEIVKYIVGQIKKNCDEIKFVKINKRSKNLVLRAKIIMSVVQRIEKNKFDIFKTNLVVISFMTKLRLFF